MIISTTIIGILHRWKVALDKRSLVEFSDLLAREFSWESMKIASSIYIYDVMAYTANRELLFIQAKLRTSVRRHLSPRLSNKSLEEGDFMMETRRFCLWLSPGLVWVLLLVIFHPSLLANLWIYYFYFIGIFSSIKIYWALFEHYYCIRRLLLGEYQGIYIY